MTIHWTFWTHTDSGMPCHQPPMNIRSPDVLARRPAIIGNAAVGLRARLKHMKQKMGWNRRYIYIALLNNDTFGYIKFICIYIYTYICMSIFVVLNFTNFHLWCFFCFCHVKERRWVKHLHLMKWNRGWFTVRDEDSQIFQPTKTQKNIKVYWDRILFGVSLCMFFGRCHISNSTYIRHVSQFLMELELALQDFTSVLLGLCRNFSTINFSYFEDCLACDSSKLQENSLTNI